MKYLIILLTIVSFTNCSPRLAVERSTYFPKRVEEIPNRPKKENVWVFILAGQSNMAGRGIVQPRDTMPDKRVLTINKDGQLVLAKEPIHFYEPNLTGLDCGLAFAKRLIKKIPDSITLLILPTAIGGSSISQWLGDSLYRGVHLFSNFTEKVNIGRQNGMLKGILWHQGESDSHGNAISQYKQRLGLLFSKFRALAGNDQLPVILAELGSFSDNPVNFSLINKAIHEYTQEDTNSAYISTADLKDKGDHLHFNSKGQRAMGKRFANVWLKKFFPQSL